MHLARGRDLALQPDHRHRLEPLLQPIDDENFHRPSSAVLVVAQSIRRELTSRGFGNLVPWSRGVDIAAFKPCPRENNGDARPIWLYAGRLAIEKNIQPLTSGRHGLELVRILEAASASLKANGAPVIFPQSVEGTSVFQATKGLRAVDAAGGAADSITAAQASA